MRNRVTHAEPRCVKTALGRCEQDEGVGEGLRGHACKHTHMRSSILQAPSKALKGQTDTIPALSRAEETEAGRSVLTRPVSALPEEVPAAGKTQLGSFATGWGDKKPATVPQRDGLLAQGLGSTVLCAAGCPLAVGSLYLSHPSLLWLGWTSGDSVHVLPARSTQEVSQALQRKLLFRI